MKTTLSILVLAAFCLSATLNADPVTHEERIIKLRLGDGASSSTFDVSNLENGDNQTFYLDDGREVVIYNNDGNIEITLDGEPLNLPTTIHKEVKVSVIANGEGGDEDIVIHRLGGASGTIALVNGAEISIDSLAGKGKHMMFISKDGTVNLDGHEDIDWEALGKSGHMVKMFGSRSDPAAHLLASGVLDEVDEDTKQRILDTLKELQPHAGHKVIMIESEEDDIEQ